MVENFQISLIWNHMGRKKFAWPTVMILFLLQSFLNVPCESLYKHYMYTYTFWKFEILHLFL